MASGTFISFEGGDGVGKSTQIKLLAQRLEEQGHQVVLLREPGSTPSAEKVRQLILNGEPGDWLPMSELLLMNAARHDLVERVIKPSLDQCKIVLTDRFADSSRAYQLGGGGVDWQLGNQVIAAATGGLEPDLTVLLQLQASQGLERTIADGGDERRFEAKGLDFQERASKTLDQLADLYPDRVVPVSADGSIEQVHERIFGLLSQRLSTISALGSQG